MPNTDTQRVAGITLDVAPQSTPLAAPRAAMPQYRSVTNQAGTPVRWANWYKMSSVRLGKWLSLQPAPNQGERRIQEQRSEAQRQDHRKPWVGNVPQGQRRHRKA